MWGGGVFVLSAVQYNTATAHLSILWGVDIGVVGHLCSSVDGHSGCVFTGYTL